MTRHPWYLRNLDYAFHVLVTVVAVVTALVGRWDLTLFSVGFYLLGAMSMFSFISYGDLGEDIE